MKFKSIGCLSSGIVYCLSINSVFALSKIPEPLTNLTPSAQIAPVIIARRVNPNVQRELSRQRNEERRLLVEQKRLERQQRQEQRRQLIEQKRLERQQRQEQRRQLIEQKRLELEAARQAATEQQRLEAERRRQYFESLSPEEKKIYINEQEVKKSRADGAAGLLLLMLFVAGSMNNSNDVQPEKTFDPCENIPTFNLPPGHPCK
ncbi:MAG: hypothetical protein KME64_30905 [Scytonematopsis contorta HA4267-MV1]|jgi:flagellar biosynthesis GTPase FlhF|nr:hypothetical protein [Scytonematopsis contorta HA4267-MV1]